MTFINENFLKLKAGYLFPEITRRVNVYLDQNPEADVIKLGIGDVTEPLSPAVVSAMHTAVDEMAANGTFHGYGPEQGYGFLADAIISNDYNSRAVELDIHRDRNEDQHSRQRPPIAGHAPGHDPDAHDQQPRHQDRKNAPHRKPRAKQYLYDPGQ